VLEPCIHCFLLFKTHCGMHLFGGSVVFNTYHIMV